MADALAGVLRRGEWRRSTGRAQVCAGPAAPATKLNLPPETLLPGGKFLQPQPPFAQARARRREWVMTNPLNNPDELSPPRTNGSLTAGDAERIATAIDAELAASTRETYECAWRQWDRWCRGRGIDSLPAPPKALAAFLAERAEAG